MGGRGSTRWRNHSKRTVVEAAKKIDLRDPQWKALLARERADGTLYWSDRRSGTPTGWTDFLLGPVIPGGTRNLALDTNGDPYETKQLVSLGLRPAGFSAHWFAGCRSCNRWVRTLFAISQHDRFKCRKCAGLTYRSTQQHDSRLDLARRDPVGFAQSRSRAPKTLNSQLVTASLAREALDPWRPGRGWGRKSITAFDRMRAKFQREWEDRWGRPFPTSENPLPISVIDV